MDLPGFSRQFITSGRLGFYFRVLEEGEVGAATRSSGFKAGPEKITVWELARLYYFEYKQPGKRFAGFYASLRLPPDWSRAFEEILAAAGEKRKETQNTGEGMEGIPELHRR